MIGQPTFMSFNRRPGIRLAQLRIALGVVQAASNVSDGVGNVQCKEEPLLPS